LQATERELAHPSSEQEALKDYLARLHSEKPATMQRANSMKALEGALADPNGEALKWFLGIGEELASSQQLKQAASDLKQASAERKSVPW
jgi:hypothetical protein